MAAAKSRIGGLESKMSSPKEPILSVSSGRLSTLELIRIIANQCEQYQQFITEAVRCGLIVGEEFAGWQGIDSRLCVILIHLGIEHSKKNTFPLPSFKEEVLSGVYSLLYLEYDKACKDMKLPFVPCIKGLSTILKRKLIREKVATTSFVG